MSSKKHLILAKCYDKKGNLLSVAYNSYTKTHPAQKEFAAKAGQPYKEYLHAEIHAMIRAKGKPIYKLTIERYNAHGVPQNSAPCPVCLEAIKAFSVKVIKHT